MVDEFGSRKSEVGKAWEFGKLGMMVEVRLEMFRCACFPLLIGRSISRFVLSSFARTSAKSLEYLEHWQFSYDVQVQVLGPTPLKFSLGNPAKTFFTS
jgi:hypothetical protein